ncbi:hypothetical protein KAT08_04040 [Candidatus Babeliales bacterium]|nr:hypothetical protein [Candidatus Babeliales bacterium]
MCKFLFILLLTLFFRDVAFSMKSECFRENTELLSQSKIKFSKNIFLFLKIYFIETNSTPVKVCSLIEWENWLENVDLNKEEKEKILIIFSDMKKFYFCKSMINHIFYAKKIIKAIENFFSVQEEVAFNNKNDNSNNFKTNGEKANSEFERISKLLDFRNEWEMIWL